MLWPVISKLEEDQVEKAVIVIPRWPTQSWFPQLMEKAMDVIEISSDNLLLPGTNHRHPMAPRLKLLAVLCNGKENRRYLRQHKV